MSPQPGMGILLLDSVVQHMSERVHRPSAARGCILGPDGWLGIKLDLFKAFKKEDFKNTSYCKRPQYIIQLQNSSVDTLHITMFGMVREWKGACWRHEQLNETGGGSVCGDELLANSSRTASSPLCGLKFHDRQRNMLLQPACAKLDLRPERKTHPQGRLGRAGHSRKRRL
eukprot:scaffold82187_cov16-Tisochrysis_lutea.AAC.1